MNTEQDKTEELLKSLINGNQLNNRQIALFAALRIKEIDRADLRDTMAIADLVFAWLSFNPS